MVKDIITSTDLKYAQWNPFFVSLQRDLDEIKNLNKIIRKDTKLIEDYYSLINTLFNSHVVYSPKIQTKLNKIENKLFSGKYQRDLAENLRTSKMLTFQFMLIKELEHCFQLLVGNFELNGLLPKRIFTTHKPKGRALLN